MQLRRELNPPALDAALVARLTDLAASLDGAAPGQWEDNLAEFNRLAGTAIPFEEFQGIYGAEDHEDYVRRLLFRRHLAPDPALTPEEMAEIVSRVMACAEGHEFYLEQGDLQMSFMVSHVWGAPWLVTQAWRLGPRWPQTPGMVAQT